MTLPKILYFPGAVTSDIGIGAFTSLLTSIADYTVPGMSFMGSLFGSVSVGTTVSECLDN